MTKSNKLKLDIIDRKILNIVQTKFPLVIEPYKEISKEINISEMEVIDRLKQLKENKIIRRISPVINIDSFGGYSTLVALKVKESDIEKTSKIINEYPEVSHNYIRDYDLNMWFTLSTENEDRALIILNEIERKLNCNLLSLPTCHKYKINVNFNV